MSCEKDFCYYKVKYGQILLPFITLWQLDWMVNFDIGEKDAKDNPL